MTCCAATISPSSPMYRDEHALFGAGARPRPIMHAGHRMGVRTVSSQSRDDHGHYGETGSQKSHTSLGVDLEKIAVGSGIRRTRTINSQDELADGHWVLREGNGAAFVLLRVKPNRSPRVQAQHGSFRLPPPLSQRAARRRLITGVTLHGVEHR